MAILTLARLRAHVAANLGLSNVSGSDEETLMTEWLNEGYEDACLQTHSGRRRTDLALTEGEQEYSLPSNILAVLEMYNTSGLTDYAMERVTLQEIVGRRRVTGSAPARVYYAEGDYLEVYPAAGGAGESLTYYYVPRPTALADDADVPSQIPAEFHQLLEYYATWRGAMMDENKPSAFGAIWMGLYEDGVSKLRAANHRRGGSRTARARVGRRRVFFSDPSVPRY